MTYREALGWLYGQQLHGIKLGLENMQRLCAELAIDFTRGGPERADNTPAAHFQAREISNAEGQQPFYIHVAGTNGKGSVCAMLASIYRAAGFRTGLYTSPHLVTFRERIQLNGEMIPERDVAEGLTRIRQVVEAWDPRPTFFELVTALALDWFQDRHAHIVILETGLGGRLDATNVISPIAAVLTPIDFDHERYLGDTLAEIAGEKCGIIKPGVPVISAPQQPEVRETIRLRAAAHGSDIFEPVKPIDPEVRIGLPGSHQRRNAALARETVEVIATTEPFLTVPAPALLDGLANVRWPGRFDRIGERVVLDGAHNPAAASMLARTWQDEFGQAKATLVVGVMRDKNVRGVLAALLPVAANVLTVRVNNDRACSAEELAELSADLMPHLPVETCQDLAEALRRAGAHANRTLIAGSLFLVGEALVALGLADACEERSAQ